MYRQIMVPVDLVHAETLDKAVAVAADLSRHYGAPVTLLGVTASGPTHVAGTPEQYRARLAAFAGDHGRRHGVDLAFESVVDPDPTADLHSILVQQVEALGADLVVMASHVPGLQDWLFSSNASHLVSHTDVSIFVVR